MKKGLLILACVLIVIGSAIFLIAFAAADNDISKLGTVKTQTNTYTAEGDFTDISIVTSESDVSFKVAEDDKLRVVCIEREKVKHDVSVSDNTLKIVEIDERKWYDHLVFFSPTTSVTVFLPKVAYSDLRLEASTGDVSVPEEFSFTSAEIAVSTGDVLFRGSVVGGCKIETSTGDLTLENAILGKTELSVSTGEIKVSSVSCTGDLAISVSTGAATLSDVTTKDLRSTGSTGKVTLKNVVAAAITVERSTGDIIFDRSDAAEITVKTTTGDVKGSLLSAKIFLTQTSTGDVFIPESLTGGPCRIETTTGDIQIEIVAA